MAKEILLIEISETGARVVKRNINDIGKSADNTQDAIEQLKTALGGLISAKLLKDTIMLADVYANLMNRLRVVTASNYELTKAMEGVYEMTLDTRTSLEANIDLYSRVAINTKQMGFEIYDVLKFSKQLNHAIILSGVTAREAQWGMIQFSQALASNALRGDELRAVLEQLPVVTDVIARHFGVTRGELRLLGFQGRITAKEIIEAFAEAEEELAERFAKRLPTIDQGLTAIRSSVIKFIGSQDQAAQVTGNLAKILLWAAHNMDTLGRFAEVAAIVIGGVLLTNVLKLISSFKVLRLTIFMTHPVLMAFATAASLVVVYSDKVKIATDSTATLSDVVIVFGERWAHTFAAMGRGIGKVINAVSGSVGKFSLTFESVTMAGAKFIDTLLGGLTGLGFVMNNIVIDTWGSIQRVWNAGLTFLESINDHIDAFIETIGDKLKIFGIKAKLMFIALAGAVRQMLAGNVEQAKIFANAAVNAFKQGVAGASFDELFDKNLKAAQVQDSLAFAKGAGELTGETFGEAFERGFKSSDFIQTGMEEIFARAREIAAGRGTGGITEGIDQMAMTPIEAELFRDMTGDMEKLAASGEALNNIFFKQVYVNMGLLENQFKTGKISQVEFRVEVDRMLPSLLQYTDSIKELDMLVDRGILSQESYAEALVVVEANMKGLSKTFRQGELTLKQYQRKMEELKIKSLEASTEMLAGYERGFRKVGLEIADFASTAEDAVVNAFHGMEDAIANFVLTGREDWKNLVQLMLTDLTRLMVRFMLLKAIGMAFPSKPDGATDAAGGATDAVPSSSLPKRALGGPVSAGVSYWVGERGPELFTPNNSGGITDNQRSMVSMPTPEYNVTVVNVWSEEDVLRIMDSSEGQRIIINRSPGRGHNQSLF